MTKLNAAQDVVVTLSRGGGEIINASFRRARADDLKEMYKLSLPFMDSGNLIVRDWEVFEEMLEDFYVIEIDEMVVACSGIRRFPACAEIFNVAVDRNWQGLGLGRVLLASMIAAAHAAGLADVVVFTKTTSTWFERHGFTPFDAGLLLPAERLSSIDPERGSIPLRRATVNGFDGVDALAKVIDLRVRFQRSGSEFVWDSTFDSLLQFAEHHGIEPESLCWAGVCGTCSTRLKCGSVRYHVEPAAKPEEGEVLLCVSQPVTDLTLDL